LVAALPRCDYKGQAQMEKEIPQLYEAGKNLWEKMGAKKAE
jgi:hypothetical protein